MNLRHCSLMYSVVNFSCFFVFMQLYQNNQKKNAFFPHLELKWEFGLAEYGFTVFRHGLYLAQLDLN